MASLDASFDFAAIKSEILASLEGHKFLENINNHLEHILSEISDIDHKDAANRWLSWARGNSSLKVISVDVPDRILPSGYEGKVHDVKVFTKFGPDDKIYDNDKEIRARVARGNCFLEFTNKSRRTVCALQAMKKFTGGLGDDDDRDSGEDGVWQKYFTKPLEETDYVVVTEKANGEAAHLSCLQIDDQFVMCGGSKNVHLMFRNKDDIRRYVEPRYRIATEVCHTVIDFINQMDEANKNRLLSFLVASRYTAVFEILSPDHQHVVDLSHLKKPVLKFISWTKCELEPSEKLHHLNVVPPHVGIEIARALGLDPVNYDLVQMNGLDERMKQVRQGYNLEGEVLFFIDKAGAVIGILKKKTVWYIMCRAVREKIKTACGRSQRNPETFSKSKSLSQVERRVKEIQTWLSLDEATTDTWKVLGTDCMKWALCMVDDGKLSQNEVQDLFPVYWNRFLKETGATDQIKVGFSTSQSSGASQSPGACAS